MGSTPEGQRDRNRELEVREALQLALLGEVSRHLRAVTVSYDFNSVSVDCYFDGKVSDDDRESMSLVETELLAWFPQTHSVTLRMQRLDFPNLIPKDRLWVFHRKESI